MSESESSSEYATTTTSSSGEENYGSAKTAQQQKKGLGGKANESETDVEFHTMKFGIDLSFTPRQLLKGLSSHGGAILLSAAEESLIFIECDHAPDYERLQSIISARKNLSSATPMELGTKKGKKKKKKNKSCGLASGEIYNDIAQKIGIEKFSSTWKKAFVISLPTVPKYQKEAYFEGSPFVSKWFISADMDSIEFINRRITHGSMKFHDQYQGVTPSTLEKHISRHTEKKYAIVDFGSPIISYNNNDSTAKKIYKAPTKGFEDTNQVMMPLDEAEKYLTIAKNEMTSKISYANITNDFQLAVSVPMGPTAKANHEKWLATSGKEGEQFKGFCDFKYAHPGVDPKELASNGKTNYDNFLDTVIEFKGIVTAKYRHCNGKLFVL